MIACNGNCGRPGCEWTRKVVRTAKWIRKEVAQDPKWAAYVTEKGGPYEVALDWALGYLRQHISLAAYHRYRAPRCDSVFRGLRCQVRKRDHAPPHRIHWEDG